MWHFIQQGQSSKDHGYSDWLPRKAARQKQLHQTALLQEVIMGASDFNISVRLDAGVTGAQNIKDFTVSLGNLFTTAGNGNTTVGNAVGRAGKAMSEVQKQAQELAKDFAKTFSGDVTYGLAKGLDQADATVKKITADLKAMYAAKAGNPTAVLQEAIKQTEIKLQEANKDLKVFQELSGKASSSATGVGSAPGASAGAGGLFSSLGLGSFIGGLTAAQLLTKAITSGFEAIKNAISDVVSEGMKMNEFLEISKLGIATAIMAQYNLVDAQGKLLTGQDAYNAALALSEKQMKEIRIAGLETAATSQELVKNFQTAMGVGASQGITDINKLRQVTIDMTNAATALGISQEEVPTAIRGVLTGLGVEHNQLSRILVGSGEQVRNWQMQGKLLDELNQRLTPFTEGAKQAASSWAVVKSNIEEAFQVFSGEITEGLFDKLKTSANDILGGVFDTKNLGISEKFSAITGTLKDLFSGIGTVLSDSLTGGVGILERINGFLVENKDTIDEWKKGFSEIWIAVKGLFGTAVDIVAAVFNIKSATGELSLITNTISIALKTIAILVAGLADGFRVVGAAVLWVGGLIDDAIAQPVQGLLLAAADVLDTMHQGWGAWAREASDSVGQVGEKIRKVGANLIAPVANGTGAVANLMKSFSDMGAEAEKAGKKASTATGTITGAKNPNVKTQKQGLSAQSAVAKAEADVAVNAAKDALDREQRNLDYALSQQLISIKDYYSKKKAEQTAAVKADEAAKQKELDAVEAATPKTKDDQETKQANIIKLQGELNILKNKEGDIIVDNNRKQQEAAIALTNKTNDLKVQLASLTGATDFDAQAAQIEEKFRLIKQQMVTEFGADSHMVSIVDRLIDTEKSKAKFTELQNQYNVALDSMKAKEAEIQRQETEGNIGPIEAYKQIKELHVETAAELEKIIPLLDQYAQKIGDPSLVTNVTKLKTETAGVSKATSDIGKSIGSGVTNNLANFFNDLATGAKSGSDAVKDFGKAVLATFAQILSQQMALMTMKAMFAGTSFGGFMGFADGGYISGPGTGTSDSIPILASNGEYVVRSSAVRNLGVGFLDMINGLSSRPMHAAFADGGPVTSAVGPGQAFKNENKIINLFDPSLVEGMLSSRKGENAVLNIIGNNPQYIKALLS
jgi:hypothetical protein